MNTENMKRAMYRLPQESHEHIAKIKEEFALRSDAAAVRYALKKTAEGIEGPPGKQRKKRKGTA